MPFKDKNKAKEYNRNYLKVYRKNNKEKVREWSRKHRENHKEEIKNKKDIYMKGYRKRPEVQERIKKYSKEYLKRPEVQGRKKEYSKNYYNKNKKKILEYLKRPYVKERRKKYREKWKEKNPNYMKEYMREYTKQYNWKEYHKRPEVQKRQKEYYKKNKDHQLKKWNLWKENNKERYLKRRKKYYEENKEKHLLKSKECLLRRLPERRKWEREYKKRPEIKNKLRNNLPFIISTRIRHLLRHALKKYTLTGKIMHSNKYGIDFKAIIEHLKPFPNDISEYHIDHIKPLCSFNFINYGGSTNLEEVKKAFAPENHQWLLAKDNLIKGSKILR